MVKMCCSIILLSTLSPLFALLFSNSCVAQQQLQQIGQWREHLPYHSAIDVESGSGFIYAATPYSIFYVDVTGNSVTRMSRVTGLAETAVNSISINSNSGKLLVAYSNSNLDIIYRNDVFNIPDIHRDNIIGDKTIYDIYPHKNDFYLSAGIGVIIINGDRHEVKDTWVIGNNGEKVRVNSFTANSNHYYAATIEGLKRTSLTSDPANYLNWEILSGSGLPPGNCKDVLSIGEKIISLCNDSLFVLNNSTWNFFYAETGWTISNINTSNNQVLVMMKKIDGSSRVTILNNDGNISRTIIHPQINVPKNAIIHNSDVWVADSTGGLLRFSTSGYTGYQLNSPRSISTGQLIIDDGDVYAAAGEVDNNWQPQQNRNGFYKFKDGQWTNYDSRSFPILDSIRDVISLAVGKDKTVWAGSYGNGLIQINGNNFQFYKNNSPISPAVSDPGSYRITGLSFDNDQNLWVSNHGAMQPIVVRKKDGTWKKFTLPLALPGNTVSTIIHDNQHQKWIISPGNGLILFDHGVTLDDISDDRWKFYRTGVGVGNLPSNNVLSIAKDKDGFIWVGTDDGIGIIQCPEIAFMNTGCDAFLPVVQQGGFNNYLFKGERVNAIAVDGANRKWIGTPNGVWLLDAAGDKTIYRFTEQNSFLLSNDVRSIAINTQSGEVYFGTAKGISSFRSTSTDGSMKNDNVLVFPNPVPPGYSGTIAIRGVTNNALIKITEIDGRLVYQTRALGGQAIWDGRNYRGQKISSGIYLILVTDDNRKENYATKIVFIRNSK